MKNTRRGFLKKAAGALGGTAAAAYGANEVKDGLDEGVETTGHIFGPKATSKLVEKAANGDTQKITAYNLAEKQPELDWGTSLEKTEQYLSNLHEDIDPEIEYIELTPENITEETGIPQQRYEEMLENIDIPSAFPGYKQASIGDLHEQLEPLETEDADAELLISDFIALAQGKAAPGYGMAFIDSGDIDSEKRAGWISAHEIAHLYGATDKYIPTVTQGEGLMGTKTNTEPTQETVDEIDRMVSKFE